MFDRLAQWVSRKCGSSAAFLIACAIILVWGASGPMFNYSDGWQLTVNTGTTIITFLMVFLIQATQNRDMAVLQLKLDELIRVTEKARNQLISLDDATSEDLEQIKAGMVAGDSPNRDTVRR